MNKMLTILGIILIIIYIIIMIDIVLFMNKNKNKLIEDIKKALLVRIDIMIVLTVLIGLISIIKVIIHR